ncbi:ankyrin repeat protein [Fusarium acuminatum]|uniref:Ankyrin repeat protein n=1 Tax=Fusarium acuminatum TaxID=5515 RepID=A0ABZ2WY93_9HYPO
MDSLLEASMANLSIDERLQLLAALMDDSSEESSVRGDEMESESDEGTGPEIISHQAATALMDAARRFVPSQPIVNAAIRGDISLLRRLLQQPGAFVDVKDGIGETALFAAISHDQTDAAALLLEFNADANIHCTNTWMPLHLVARSGNTALAILLLEWGADAAARDSCGWAPLHVSSLYGTSAIAELLLEANTDPDLRASDQRTPLHTAVDYGQTEVIRLLVERNADRDAKDDEGRTPLHIAAMKRPFPPPVSLLLELGALANSIDTRGYTALHMAVAAGHDPVLAVEPLLQRGVDPDTVTSDGCTPLLLAIQHVQKPGTHRLAILQTLVQLDAIDLNRVSPRSGKNTSPLLHAVEVKSRRAIEILTDHGADANRPVDQDGKSVTPVLQAAAFHDPEEPQLLRALLDAGVKATEQIQCGITLGHIASLNGNIECLKLLIERNIDVNAADERGGTLLHLAARNRRPECIALLLQHGANIDPKAADRSTPLHDAARNGDEESIRLLLDAGADMSVTSLETGLPTPLDVLRETYLATEDEEARERLALIVFEMMERMAERDPLTRELRPDRQEGWLLRELSQRPPEGNSQRPHGPTVAEIRRRYQSN